MKKLSGYIKENRKLNQNVNVSYGWEDEIYENTKALFYDVNTTYGIKKVFAFVSFPTSKKPTGGYPVIILIHGGNGCAFYEMTKLWADRGYVAIAPDFNGTYAKNITQRKLDNEKADIKGYGSFHDIDAENPWAYFSVLSCMSALDFLLSQEIVNEEFIFSCGVSWGGFINLLFASQEKRLKAISIIYSSAYISHSKWARQERICGNMSESDWDIYNEHIDPQTYLVDIECPVFFTAGTNDTAFTMENRRKTAEKINQLKYFGYREHFEHGNFIGFEQPESDVFFKSFIMNKPIKNICYKLNGKEIRVLNEIKTAQYLLMETTEDYDNEDVLAWTKRPFSRKISLKEDTKTFFIQKKEKGYIFSTDIINVKE